MNQPQVSPIMAALYKGQQDVVDTLLSKDPTLSVFEAAALGDARQLQVHLDSDPNTANVFSVDGFSPLHLACFMGQHKTEKLLIESGANVNSVATNGTELRPINSAAACRNLIAAVEIVSDLIRSRADLSAKQKGGYSALHSAAANGNLVLVRLLLEHGADQNTASDDGKTPLQFAQERNRTEIVEFLTNQRLS